MRRCEGGACPGSVGAAREDLPRSTGDSVASDRDKDEDDEWPEAQEDSGKATEDRRMCAVSPSPSICHLLPSGPSLRTLCRSRCPAPALFSFSHPPGPAAFEERGLRREDCRRRPFLSQRHSCAKAPQPPQRHVFLRCPRWALSSLALETIKFPSTAFSFPPKAYRTS